MLMETLTSMNLGLTLCRCLGCERHGSEKNVGRCREIFLDSRGNALSELKAVGPV